ncbi:MAG TPA: disulfide bond formation protein B [Xanthomonadaceae bacterium]|nr:disulfide bond formation protein B [Xanthomonadaceae bacterium]
MSTEPARDFRMRYLAGFVACAALLGFALYSQLHGGLEPCPLCIFQRVGFAALGLVFLLGGLHAPRSAAVRRLYGVLALLAAAAGAAIAGRHVWLQSLPKDQVPACGPALDYMLDSMPIAGVVRKVLTGSGECANVDWSLLGLSMPAWSLIWFILLAGWAVHAAWRGGDVHETAQPMPVST